MCVSSVSWN